MKVGRLELEMVAETGQSKPTKDPVNQPYHAVNIVRSTCTTLSRVANSPALICKLKDLQTIKLGGGP